MEFVSVIVSVFIFLAPIFSVSAMADEGKCREKAQDAVDAIQQINDSPWYGASPVQLKWIEDLVEDYQVNDSEVKLSRGNPKYQDCQVVSFEFKAKP